MIFKKSGMHICKKDFFLLPNILTYIRILLVPVFVLCYINSNSLKGNIWSAIIVLISGLTDVLDGFIARHWNMISDLGKIIDPIADKAMQFAMMICVIFKYPWVLILVIIYAVKEIVSFLSSTYLFTRGKRIDGAMWCGKICTVILFLVMITFVAVPEIPMPIVTTLVGFAAAFMFLAFFIYMRTYFRLWIEYLNEQKQVLKTDMAPLDYASGKSQNSETTVDNSNTAAESNERIEAENAQ